MKTNPSAGNRLLIFCMALWAFTSCTKGDGTQPSSPNLPPVSFEVSITELKQKSVTLSWTEARDPEGKEVTYRVALGSDTINRYAERTITISNLEENRNYEVSVIASDPQGASTKKTLSFTTKEYDLPSSFGITLEKVGGSIASVNWTPSTLPDNSPVQYDVYINDQLVQPNLTNTVLHYEFSKLKEQTLYTAKVIAKSSFNKTRQSTISFTTVQDPAPTGLTVQVKAVSYSLAKFSIGAATDAEGQAIRYSVSLDNSDVSAQLDTAITPGREYVLRSLSPERNYKLVIKATDEGGKTSSIETAVNTLKQPILVIDNKSITASGTGFVYNLETGVDYKPSRIVLYANGNPITTQPTASSIINGNTISYTYPNSLWPGEGNYSIAANLFWGDDTEKSRTATFNSYSYYNFVPTSVAISQASIDISYSYKTFLIFFQNNIISPDPAYSIVEVVFGTQKVEFSIFRWSDTTGYLTGFSSPQFSAIDAGPKTGYVIMKDNTGYHKLNFTFSYF